MAVGCRGAMSDVSQQKGVTSLGLRLLVNKSRIFRIVAFCWGEWVVGAESDGSLVPWSFSAWRHGGEGKCSQGEVDGRSWEDGP